MPSQAQLRKLSRALHDIGAIAAALAVYVPVIPADVARLVLAAAAVPLLALTGLFMAKQATIRRFFSRRPRSVQAAR